jgi:hypothetical protein
MRDEQRTPYYARSNSALSSHPFHAIGYYTPFPRLQKRPKNKSSSPLKAHAQINFWPNKCQKQIFQEIVILPFIVA